MSNTLLSSIRATQAIVLLLVALNLFLLTRKLAQFRRRRQFARRHGCQPITARFPFKFPYLGLDRLAASRKAQAEDRIMEFTLDGYRRAGGHTYNVRVFHKDILLTAEPANMKAIFATNFEDWATGGRLEVIGPLIGKGIFTADGQDWKHSRTIIRPNFVRAQVGNIDDVEVYLQDLFKLLPEDGRTVDLQPLFFALTMDTSTEFLFGESVLSLRGDSGTAFTTAYDTAAKQCFLRATQPPWEKLMGQSKEDKQNCKTTRDFVQRYVDAALKWRQAWSESEKLAPAKKYTFLFELAKETTDREKLTYEVLNLLLAGRDTTASLLGSMFFQLARRPDVWARLRAEVAELEGARPSFEQLKNMKLLQWCMKETLRVNTVVPTIIRAANKDTVLPVGGGSDGRSPIFVEAGKTVFCSMGAMHRREDIWGPDAGLWKPDRWATARPGAWDYIPFHGGPRACLGQQYALTEAGYVTARMAQTFSKLESRDAGRWRGNFGLTCSSKETLVSLTKA